MSSGNSQPSPLLGGQPRTQLPQPTSAFDSRLLPQPQNLYQLRQTLVPPQLGTPGASPTMANLRPASMSRETPNALPPPFSSAFMGSQVPPVTVLVPCPIIMPIPVPIPIPINIPEFWLKLLSSEAASENHSTRRASGDLNNNNGTPPPNDSIKKDQGKADGTASTHHKDESDSDVSETETSLASNEVVPKIKITRLQSKRILTTRELDSTRPLRKRKRMVGIGSEV